MKSYSHGNGLFGFLIEERCYIVSIMQVIINGGRIEENDRFFREGV
jgi:hypothetical protein